MIALSNYVVGHSIWLSISAYSLWVAFPDPIGEWALDSFAPLSAYVSRPETIQFLGNYGLRPLIPVLILTIGVFVLHAHSVVLDRIGRYTPPELVLHWMPGMRGIELGRWMAVLESCPSYDFNELRSIVEARYPEALEKRAAVGLPEVFNYLKALALINLVAIPFSNSSGTSLWLTVGFVSASAIAVLLQIYHERNESEWAIEDVLRTVVAEFAVSSIEKVEPQHDMLQQRQIASQFWHADRGTPILTLSWSLPLVGNIRVLSESLARHDSKREREDSEG